MNISSWIAPCRWAEWIYPVITRPQTNLLVIHKILKTRFFQTKIMEFF